MQKQRVESSVIRTIAHDAQKHVLEVEFRTGKVYRYFRVPPAVYDALVNADSVGRYFNEVVKPRFRWAKVR